MHKTLLALFIVGWFFIETSMVEAYDKIDETNTEKSSKKKRKAHDKEQKQKGKSDGDLEG